MAAPVVSGAMALLLSKYPDMSNVEAKLKLRSSSRRIETTQGWGLLQVEQLLE
ncbi:MAG: S8 family serine peptidase [Christensenellales bacterium]